MAIFDFPLDKLDTYMGTNPCPVDFDVFWKDSLEEMRLIEPNIECIPAQFQTPFAECFDLYFTGVRNARLHAKLLRPKNQREKGPALLQFHGYNGNAGDWSDKLNYVAAGFTVAALDCRGQGVSEDTGGVKGMTSPGLFIRGIDDVPKNMIMRHIMLDTAQIADILMGFDFVKSNQLCVYGASQGGALALACAALEPRVAKVCAMYPFLSDYQRVWEMDLAKDAYYEITHYFRNCDPEHSREKEVFIQLGYIDIKNMAKWIKGEVLMATALQDRICPPSTQFAVYNRIQSKKNHILYPDYQHEWIPQIADRFYQFMLQWS